MGFNCVKVKKPARVMEMFYICTVGSTVDPLTLNKKSRVASGYHARPGRSGVTGGPDNLQGCTSVNLPGILTDTRVTKSGDTISF